MDQFLGGRSGGFNVPGVYFSACEAHGLPCLTFTEASRLSSGDKFAFVCRDLLDKKEIKPAYDYIFVDEGQDFPVEFIRLCIKVSTDHRVVFAYDDLQTIFQATTPTVEEIVGTDSSGKFLIELKDDIVLFKCYRNPREVLLCAHALGFGLYGSRIVQMLENREHWEDIGYRVISGEFVEGSPIVIERPAEYSHTAISDVLPPNKIIKTEVCSSFGDKIKTVAQSIKQDIENGLRPDDIIVIVVDDRNAKSYLSHLEEYLANMGIRNNNIHTDAYGLRYFVKDNQVTLSTVYKAKGNEAFMVYIVGVDALFSSYASVRERNIIFTAMTRAKGWVRISGIGEGAKECKKEIDIALQNFPFLKFNYPGPGELKIMKRDLEEGAIRKLKVEKMLDEIMEEMTPDEIKRFMEQKSISKGKKREEIIKR